MIVPDDDERERGVGGLKSRIGAVLGVAVPIIFDRHQLAAHMLAHAILHTGILVNVVTQVHHKIQFFFGQVFVGRVKALFVLLA